MTVFMVKDNRAEEPAFRVVPKKKYKKMARDHDVSGQPLRAETEYRNGMPFKLLTLLDDGIDRTAIVPTEQKRKWIFNAKLGKMIRLNSEGKATA